MMMVLMMTTMMMMMIPLNRCESEEDGTLTLHYYSCRKGLSYLVKGTE